MQELIREYSALEFLYAMTDEDLKDVINMGEIDKFCNALTIDLAEVEYGLTRIKNKA